MQTLDVVFIHGAVYANGDRTPLALATGVLGFVGDIDRFPSARHFANHLGPTPRE